MPELLFPKTLYITFKCISDIPNTEYIIMHHVNFTSSDHAKNALAHILPKFLLNKWY